MDLDLNEQSSATHIKPIKISTIDQIKTQSSNLSKPIASSSNSIVNSIFIKKLPSGNETKSETNFETDEDLSSKQIIQKLYSKNNTNQPLKVSSSYNKTIGQTSQSSNDENEIENSLNDVTDRLSQQDIIISNTNLDKLFDIPSKESNTTKQILPLLTNIDETPQHSKSSVSFDIYISGSNENFDKNPCYFLIAFSSKKFTSINHISPNISHTNKT